MSEITKAIAAKQTQITQIQSDIETLQRAATGEAPQPRPPLVSERPNGSGGR